MRPFFTRRALVLLLLQAHAAAFSSISSSGHSRPRAPSSPAAPSKTPPFPPKRKPPPLALGPRAPGQPERTHPLPLGDGRSASRGNPRRHDLPLTVLQGWFDGWGSGEKPTAGDKGGSEGRRVKGGKRDDSSSKDNAAAPSSSSRLKRGGGRTVGDKKSSSAGRERSVSTGKSGVRGENKNGKGVGAEGGPKLQSLDAVRESLVDGAAAIQDRLSMTPSPQNVTFILGGGSLTNLTVPWRGIGVYVGGVVSGLAITVGLLTVPYADIGSPGLRKSLTLFENVLVDIDQGYVEEVNPERLLETAVVSMLRTLDPYTEYQNNQAAADLKETVSGRYGGVGLVISGGKQSQQQKQQQQQQQQQTNPVKGGGERGETGAGREGTGGRGGSKGRRDAPDSSESGRGKAGERVLNRDGITVVSAFEGYAFDAGMRAGDRITAINGQPVAGISVDKARDLLRGEPNSKVSISFVRDDKNQNEREITLTRRLVKLRDVKLATLVGDTKNAPVGYLELSGFSTGAAQELRQAYRYLDSVAEGGLRGVILDLRGNPGGLLEAAVDVSAQFVPQGSSIVSIKGRNFQDITYGSSVGPVRPASIPLVVLINGGTASAAEIVSGAVQDLDAGVIVGVGNGRTYGKGLVQNVAELPYNNALKYTVAKYYTPSGRCIQSVNYKEGGVAMGDQPAIPGAGGLGYGFEASEVPEVERKEFITKHGRVVFDGGGVEADVKVKLPKPSALEIALQVQGAYFDFAGQWTRTHTFQGSSDVVTDAVLRDFQNFVYRRQKEGTYNLAGIYGPQLESLQSILEETNLRNSDRMVEALPQKLTREMLTAFSSSKEQIRSQLEEAILSRYFPESMVLREQLQKDPQFQVALELVQDRDMYDRIITPADAKLTEEVLRSFGQALKESVQRGETGDVTITPTTPQQSTKSSGKSNGGVVDGAGTGAKSERRTPTLTAPSRP
ncbi:unnamed protein product [Ascophyllum nodosum]